MEPLLLRWVDDISISNPEIEQTTIGQGLYLHEMLVTSLDENFELYRDQFTPLSFSVELTKKLKRKMGASNLVYLDWMDCLITNTKNLLENHIQQVMGIKPDFFETQSFLNKTPGYTRTSHSIMFIPRYKDELIYVRNDEHEVFKINLVERLGYISIGSDILTKYVVDILLGRVTNKTIKDWMGDFLVPSPSEIKTVGEEVFIVSDKKYAELITFLLDISSKLSNMAYIGIDLSGYDSFRIHSLIELSQSFDCQILNNCELDKSYFGSYLIIRTTQIEITPSWLLEQSSKLHLELPEVKLAIEFNPSWYHYNRLYAALLGYSLLITTNPVLAKYVHKVKVIGRYVVANFGSYSEVETLKVFIQNFNGTMNWLKVTNAQTGIFYRKWLLDREIDSILIKDNSGWVLLYSYSRIEFPEFKPEIQEWIKTLPELDFNLSVMGLKSYSTIPGLIEILPIDIPSVELDINPIEGGYEVRLWLNSYKLCPNLDTGIEIKDERISHTWGKIYTSVDINALVKYLYTYWTMGNFITDWGANYFNFHTRTSYITTLPIPELK